MNLTVVDDAPHEVVSIVSEHAMCGQSLTCIQAQVVAPRIATSDPHG